MKYFCTPRPIEQTPTKLPVNIQSNNEIKHHVACYRCMFISHNIVHNKTNSVQNQFCWNKEEAIYYVTVILSYEKNHSEMQMLKKASENVFLFQITLKINVLQIVQNNHYSDASSRTPALVLCTPKRYRYPRLRTPDLE